MDKTYNPKTTEAEIYSLWEKGGYFTPKIDKTPPRLRLAKRGETGKKPFSIILPLPNANNPMHMGHALFTIQDLMIRYHRMLGEPTLWLPGSDHAGIETQFVFEKKLKKEDKSRFGFDRKTLYKMIWDFVEENREINIAQMKKLGFSLDWTRYHYSLEPKIVENVLAAFRKLYTDGLIYRGEKMVNYCTHCGTAFSELEVDYEERTDPLFYMKYGPFVLATVRPETKFGDTAVAVHPDDKRYKDLVGKDFVYESLIGPRTIKVVADEVVDPEFGTGAVKVTPAHDPNDFEIAQRHNLPLIKVIGLDGRMTDLSGRFAGLKVTEARKKVVEELQARGDIVKIDENYLHRVGTCYRCKNSIEPMVTPQWFVKIAPLAKPAIEAAEEGKVKFFPLRFKKQYLDWMKNIKDWNISRQIAWGPPIPAWYCLDCHQKILVNFLDKNKTFVSGVYSEIKDKYGFEEIKNGLQSLTAPVDSKFILEEKDKCPDCQGNHLLQETDTFDTWFLSGQWPLNALGFNVNNPDQSSSDFKYFYPTSVMDTMWDILFFWVARMIMFGIYLAGDVPFKTVHLHARVVDKNGQKMSKSKGNVIDPLLMTEKYGTDALRMSLIFGIAPASDFVVSEEKIIAMRNFANKIWNAARFVLSNLEIKDQISKIKTEEEFDFKNIKNSDDKWILEELDKTIKTVTKQIESYHFGQAAETIYEFFWHKFCDIYIEKAKPRIGLPSTDYSLQQKQDALNTLYLILNTSLRLLHPFMPFITEKIWSMLPNQKEPLIISQWPKLQK